MKEERKFLRLCMACRKYKTKDELIRITRDYKTGNIIINNEKTAQGRSLYVCKNEECISKFIKNKKSLSGIKAQMTENIKIELYTVLKK